MAKQDALSLKHEHSPEEIKKRISNPKMLEKIVNVITSDRQLWVDTMLKDEHGLQMDTPKATSSAISTFCAFIFIGLLPLIPFIIPNIDKGVIFPASCSMAAMVFF